MRRGVFTALAIAAVLSGGCSDDKSTKPDESDDGVTYVARTSPENVLANLAAAYEGKDIAGYTDQLDPEFVFVPNPVDPDITFIELPYAEDLASTGNMFDVVESIELTLTHMPSIPSDRAEYPASSGHRLVRVQSVNLRVVTREGSAGDPLIYIVEGDPATFVFRPDSTQTPVTWRIVYQQDDA